LRGSRSGVAGCESGSRGGAVRGRGQRRNGWSRRRGVPSSERVPCRRTAAWPEVGRVFNCAGMPWQTSSPRASAAVRSAAATRHTSRALLLPLRVRAPACTRGRWGALLCCLLLLLTNRVCVLPHCCDSTAGRMLEAECFGWAGGDDGEGSRRELIQGQTCAGDQWQPTPSKIAGLIHTDVTLSHEKA
jgi:hypothetical protein